MAGLTRGQVKTRALTYLSEVGTSMWSTSQQNDLADEANRLVYDLIIECDGTYVMSQTDITWPVNAASIDLSSVSYLGAVPYKVLLVENMWQPGSISSINPPFTWEPAGYTEISRQRSVFTTQNTTTRFLYCVMDSTMQIAPVPSLQLTAKVSWVPNLSPMTSDSDYVLNNKAQNFSAEVAVALAWLMNTKDNGRNRAVEDRWAQSQERIRRNAPGQVQAPRGVQRVRGRRFL